jgi:opacity protein-like surface antigen
VCGRARNFRRIEIVKKGLIALAAVAMLASAPVSASADWLFTPFIGANWGGSASFNEAGTDFEDEFERRMDFGASLAWMGAGIAGFEIDFGYSPNFFETTSGGDDFAFGDSNVTTLMANVTLGAPIGGQSGGGIRPYASGGLGIIKSRIDSADELFADLDSTDWGFNVGAGVAGFFSDNIGIRGDVRYFRSLQDNDPDGIDLALSDFRFWRGSVGVTFRF